MSSKKEYIDLFRQYRAQLEEVCAPGLNARREQALQDFERLGFPEFGSEDYQQTNIAAAFEHDYGLNLKRLNMQAEQEKIFHCDVLSLSADLYFLVNDSFYDDQKSHADLPEGVFSGGLNDFATRFPEVFGRYYGKLAGGSNDGLVAFNTLFAQDGYVLYIPKNTVVKRPIQLISSLSGNVDMLCNRRLLVIAEESAQGKLLICDHTVDEDRKFLSTQVVEVFAGDNAVLDIYELEESSEQTTRFSSVFVSQGSHSNVVINGITLYNGLTRNNYQVALNGEYAETHVSGVVISDEQQHTDNFIRIEHNVPNCLSNQLFKYVLDGASKGSFTGRIIVAQDAQKTNAYQTNRNLCITPEARMYSRPQLEIYADDVKCSHGMTTGQLDENALFYLRSRGIPEKEARILLMFAFTSDVLEYIRIDTLKERLHHLVERRFRGESAKCGRCAKRVKQ